MSYILKAYFIGLLDRIVCVFCPIPAQAQTRQAVLQDTNKEKKKATWPQMLYRSAGASLLIIVLALAIAGAAGVAQLVDAAPSSQQLADGASVSLLAMAAVLLFLVVNGLRAHGKETTQRGIEILTGARNSRIYLKM